jgi:energy-coupling factor transporter ATP-binding protein EcfA2
VWLLDEPFSGLDPAGSALLETLIGEMRSAGRTVVMVTHDLEVGLRLADDCAAIVDGAVRARGHGAVEAAISPAGPVGPPPGAAPSPLGPPEGRLEGALASFPPGGARTPPGSLAGT